MLQQRDMRMDRGPSKRASTLALSLQRSESFALAVHLAVVLCMRIL